MLSDKVNIRYDTIRADATRPQNKPQQNVSGPGNENNYSKSRAEILRHGLQTQLLQLVCIPAFGKHALQFSNSRVLSIAVPSTAFIFGKPGFS